MEKEVTLSEDKITELPVKITSQNGEIYETSIYIEKVSNVFDLLSVKIDEEEVEKGEEENSFIKYIYDTVKSVEIKIEAKSDTSTIILTDADGKPILNSIGEEIRSKKQLIFNETIIDEITYVYFKIEAENGDTSPVYKIQIEKMDTDTSLLEVYVEGVLIKPNEKGEYTVNVLDTLESPRIKAITTSEFGTVRIALGEERLHETQERVNLGNNKQIIIPITVKAQAGNSKVTNLYINRISTNTNLERVTLDGKEANIYDEASKTYTFIVDTIRTNYELFVLAESDLCMLEFEGLSYEASFTEVVNIMQTEERKNTQS